LVHGIPWSGGRLQVIGTLQPVLLQPIRREVKPFQLASFPELPNPLAMPSNESFFIRKMVKLICN
jgi:hypothetical protein